MSPFHTNRHARALRKALVPKPYGASPYQWGFVEAIHSKTTGTLSAGVAQGATVITTNVSFGVNAFLVVGSGGPVQVLTVTGSGPYTHTLQRGVPFAQTSGATVRRIPTVDIQVDGWQNPPANLVPGTFEAGTSDSLIQGVRYLSTYTPAVGHVVLIARGTGMQRSDRIVLGRLAT